MAKFWLEHNEVKSDMDLSIFDYGKMREIRLGLMKNLDVTIYAKTEYSCNQMEEIRLGLEENIDVTIYAKPEYTWVKWKKFV